MKTVVKSLIYDDDDDLLILARSSTHPKYANEDDLPGGELENDETTTQSVIREIFEETGLMINPSESQEVFEKLVNPSTRHVIYICKASGIKPEVSLSWEHSSYIWTNIDQKYNLKSQDDYISTVNEWLALSNPAA